MGIVGAPNIFKHSREFDQGLGEVRLGQATIVVAIDGTGDTADIQEGIDLANAGDEVFIKEGNYILTKDIKVNKILKILGAGTNTILSSAAGTFANGFIINVTAEAIFENFKIDDNVLNANGGIRTNSSCIIDNVEIVFVGDSAINLISGASNSRISNCKDIATIEIEGSLEKIYILNNSILDADLTIAGTDTLDLSVISGNTFESGTMNLKNITHSVINGNTMEDASILLTGDSDFNIVSNNIVQSGTITLDNATQNKNIIIGNLTDTAISDAGTDTLVVNNLEF